MGLQINQNIAALSAHKNLGINDARLSKSLERLSSGLRINRAADDAAGLTISEKLRAQVRGLNQAVRNGQDGISMIQTAEGGLSEMHGLLQRMRELAVQSANDTLTDPDRGALQNEFSSLRSEIDRISQATEFNTKKLLTGSLTTTVTPGANLSPAAGISSIQADGALADTYQIDYIAATGVMTLTKDPAGSADTQNVTIAAPPVGLDKLDVSFGQFNVTVTVNADLTADIVAGTVAEQFVVAGGGGSLQVGANAGAENQIGISIAQTDSTTLAIDVSTIATSADANTAITVVNTAINTISSQRSDLGALQNRLDSAITNLTVSVENLSASESRIRDLDVAAEMINFTRNQIMVQAGTAMLAQANAVPQSVLSLLRG